MWLAEEAEHACALAAMAQAFGDTTEEAKHFTFFRDRRSVAGACAVRIGSAYEPGMLASYLTLGAMQEHTALTTYNAVGNLGVPCEFVHVLKEISRQEGRHLRFYKNSALALFEHYPSARTFVRLVVKHAWRPVGIDLLGLDRWKEIFFPALNNPATEEKLVYVDKILGELVQRSTPVMASFLMRQQQLNSSGSSRGRE